MVAKNSGSWLACSGERLRSLGVFKRPVKVGGFGRWTHGGNPWMWWAASVVSSIFGVRIRLTLIDSSSDSGPLRSVTDGSQRKAGSSEPEHRGLGTCLFLAVEVAGPGFTGFFG
jgi:hypothetical protein